MSRQYEKCAEYLRLIPGFGRSPGKKNENPFSFEINENEEGYFETRDEKNSLEK